MESATRVSWSARTLRTALVDRNGTALSKTHSKHAAENDGEKKTDT